DAAAQRPDARLHLLGLDPALLEGALDGVGEPLVAGQRLAGAGPAAIPVGGAVAGDGAQPGREGVGADAAAGLVEDREPDLLRQPLGRVAVAGEGEEERHERVAVPDELVAERGRRGHAQRAYHPGEEAPARPGSYQLESRSMSKQPRPWTVVAVQNSRRGTGFNAFTFKLMGFTGPEPKVPPLYKLRAVSDKAAMKRDLLALAETPGLARVVPSHGRVMAEDAAGVLRRVAERDLG